ncbi:hypothetical protein AaE_011466 [Aphanomyces astaci]|uniref:DDE Tnp4 domain-containing protein n=1 Tax=Aphanomyces astaci TaxID=112090 RepID=A0A6A4ZPK7_APHAT|nr:hypothetical protein AaE_011466 [Aphanomyces astaci]
MDKFTVKPSAWNTVKTDHTYAGWYKTHLRCGPSVFFIIAQKVEDKWDDVHSPLHHHTTFCVVDRVAVALHYLSHSDGYSTTAALFGISLTCARQYCVQVCQVIRQRYLSAVVCLPTRRPDWEKVRLGFESVMGFPNAYGAIDGPLVPIKRFTDHTGWYCRKGFPAFNIQAVVDDKLKFMSYSIRSGSQNDKALFRES